MQFVFTNEDVTEWTFTYFARNLNFLMIYENFELANELNFLKEIIPSQQFHYFSMYSVLFETESSNVAM